MVVNILLHQNIQIKIMSNLLKLSIRKQRRAERKYERWHYLNRGYSTQEVNEIIAERDLIVKNSLKKM